MKRISIIGLGKMGLLHASLLNTIPEVELVAFCEKSGLVRRFSKNVFPGVAIVGNISDLSKFNPDAAYITTPPSSHYIVAKELFSKAICHDIFIEKPLASNLTESKELVNLSLNSDIGSINMVGYNCRFGVTFKKAKEFIDDHVLGEPVSFKGYAYSSDFYSGGRKKEQRGDVTRDLACHAIDLVIWYVGNISIQSVIDKQIPNGSVMDSISFEVSSDEGLPGYIETSWIEPNYRLPEIGFIMEGNKGLTLIVNNDKLELRNKNGESQVWHKHDLNDTVDFMLGGTDYLREDRTFIDAITSRKKIEPNFSTALRVEEVIHGVEMRISGQL